MKATFKCLMIAVLVIALSTTADAVTIVVDRLDDPFPDAFCDNAIPNDCSLRDATLVANANGGPDIIQLPAGTYILTRSGASEDAGLTGDLDILDPVAIQGAGQTTTIIDAEGDTGLGDRVMYIDTNIVVEMSDFTIRGGFTGDGGGGIQNSGDTLLTRMTVTQNQAGLGGGLWNSGDLDVIDSTISRNTAPRGGGIDSNGTLLVQQSTVTNNEGTGSGGGFGGGGLLLFTGSSTVIDSTIEGNTATDLPGGGVWVLGGSLTIEDSLVIRNESVDSVSDFAGGGLAFVAGADVTIERTTIQDNMAFGERGGGLAVQDSTVAIEDSSIVWNESDVNGGGIFNDGGDIVLLNSTLARNTGPLNGAVQQLSGDIAFDTSTVIRNSGFSQFGTLSGTVGFTDSIYGANCSGGATFSSGLGNLFVSGRSCDDPGDLTVDDEPEFLLSAVADNGGPTPTAQPFADSPAIDQAENCPPPDADQRGVPRPGDDGDIGNRDLCDAGSVEVQLAERDVLFFDGFESGDTTIWSTSVP